MNRSAAATTGRRHLPAASVAGTAPALAMQLRLPRRRLVVLLEPDQAYELPDANRRARGQHVANLLALQRPTSPSRSLK